MHGHVDKGIRRLQQTPLAVKMQTLRSLGIAKIPNSKSDTSRRIKAARFPIERIKHKLPSIGSDNQILQAK
jgi:hypothetical protein